MSQTQYLFSAQAKVTPISATTSTPTPTQLANAGHTLRVVNESSVGAFLAVGDSATDTAAIATLPSAGSATSCWVGPGADFTVSIPDGSTKYASAITRSGTAQLQLYVGSGS